MMSARNTLAAICFVAVVCLFGCNKASNPPATNQQAIMPQLLVVMSSSLAMRVDT